MTRNAQMPPTDQFEPQLVEANAASATLVIEIARIQLYERNPRHGRNPEYDLCMANYQSRGN